MPIGIKLDPETLVLTRGRDFRWTFANLNTDGELEDFPEGELFFELYTGGASSSRQTITVEGATNGTYTLAIGDGVPSIPLQHYSAEGGVKSAIEALPGIGEGNVSVTAKYVPVWFITATWNEGVQLSPDVIQAANLAVNAVFDGLEFLAGGSVRLDGTYTATSFTFTLTMNGIMLEQQFVDFVVSSVAGTINTALNAIEFFTGNIADVDEIYAPTRILTISFIEDMANTPVPAIVADGSELGGYSPVVDVFVNSHGRDPITRWDFDIDESTASLKIESEEADGIPNRTKWQLVFLPDGEEAGGDPITFGKVQVQGQ